MVAVTLGPRLHWTMRPVTDLLAGRPLSTRRFETSNVKRTPTPLKMPMAVGGEARRRGSDRESPQTRCRALRGSASSPVLQSQKQHSSARLLQWPLKVSPWLLRSTPPEEAVRRPARPDYFPFLCSSAKMEGRLVRWPMRRLCRRPTRRHELPSPLQPRSWEWSQRARDAWVAYRVGRRRTHARAPPECSVVQRPAAPPPPARAASARWHRPWRWMRR